MAATEEMLAIALRHRPHAACIVPERREERTTEGGLDAAGGYHHLRPFVDSLSAAGSRLSLFIEPDPLQLQAAAKLGAPVVELPTGAYCDSSLEAPDGQRTPTHLEHTPNAAAYARHPPPDTPPAPTPPLAPLLPRPL